MTQSLRKLVFGVAVVSLVSLVAVQPASATVIINFAQTSATNTVTSTSDGTNTTIAGTFNVNITQIEGGVPVPSATMAFTMTNTGTASGAGFLTQEFAGSFAITNGGTNYLSGTFTNGTFAGAVGGSGGVFTVAQPPNGLVFTENSTITSIAVPVSFNLTFTNITPPLAFEGTSTGDFTASVTGNASGDAFQRDVVPEPGSMMLLGSGLMGLAAAARRRRQAKK